MLPAEERQRNHSHRVDQRRWLAQVQQALNNLSAHVGGFGPWMRLRTPVDKKEGRLVYCQPRPDARVCLERSNPSAVQLVSPRSIAIHGFQYGGAVFGDEVWLKQETPKYVLGPI